MSDVKTPLPVVYLVRLPKNCEYLDAALDWSNRQTSQAPFADIAQQVMQQQTARTNGSVQINVIQTERKSSQKKRKQSEPASEQKQPQPLPLIIPRNPQKQQFQTWTDILTANTAPSMSTPTTASQRKKQKTHWDQPF